MFECSIESVPANIKESSTLAINQYVKELKENQEDVVHFGFGQSPFNIHHSIQQALVEHSQASYYLPTAGLPELCQAIANYLQTQFDYCYTCDDIIIGPGSKSLLFNLLMALEGTLLIPAPSWVSYGPQAALLNKPTAYLPCFADNQYCLSPETLEAYCKQHTINKKILIINSPNNPTGQVYSSENLAQLSEICQKYNITVISDEIYALNRFDESLYSSMAHFYPTATIVTSGLSKSFGGGGYRLGYAAIPKGQPRLKQAMLTIASETYSAVSSPIQWAACDAFLNFGKHRSIIDCSNALLKRSAYYCWQQFTAMNIQCHRPQGAFYLLPDFSYYKDALAASNIHTSNQLAKALLEKYHLATLPGSDFYINENQLMLRLSPVDFSGSQLLEKYKTVTDIEKLDFSENFPQIVKGCNRIRDFINSINT